MRSTAYFLTAATPKLSAFQPTTWPSMDCRLLPWSPFRLLHRKAGCMRRPRVRQRFLHRKVGCQRRPQARQKQLMKLQWLLLRHNGNFLPRRTPRRLHRGTQHQ